MLDVLFVLVAVGFFALAGLYVRACARILGAEDPAAEPLPPDPGDASQVAA